MRERIRLTLSDLKAHYPKIASQLEELKGLEKSYRGSYQRILEFYAEKRLSIFISVEEELHNLYLERVEIGVEGLKEFEREVGQKRRKLLKGVKSVTKKIFDRALDAYIEHYGYGDRSYYFTSPSSVDSNTQASVRAESIAHGRRLRNRVAWRKLASSKIFDVVIHRKYPGGGKPKAQVGLGLSELNRVIEETFRDLGGSLEEIATSGHVRVSEIQRGKYQLEDEEVVSPRVGESSRIVYVISGVNRGKWTKIEDSLLRVFSGGVHIEILCDTLDPKNMANLLRQGLKISKYQSYIHTIWSL